ncbi:Hypothetical predicted protein [Mytilus galloprovincialis]|uniref:Uncharacterized protein n=1 Tax=Mytilus galloprovincialis TaxID=29158 RepID=A0A8B6FX60_MYTGA|nr:Hypothetical predicted protein [Mytilus galloprovincialis]
MFLGKINKYNYNSLLRVLNGIKYKGISGLVQNLYHSYNCNISCYPSYSETSEQSILMLDILFYKTTNISVNPDRGLKYHKVLSFIESLQHSESSSLNIGVCKFHYSSISQFAAQLLPSPKTINTNYYLRSRYHRHLQNGIQRDAVTGWLLYASFYYVTEQYNETIRLTAYVLSKCSPDMVKLGMQYSSEANTYKDINNYKRNVHCLMTLNAKMKTAVVDDVFYIQHSSLIPQELEMEVEDNAFIVPPFVMSHCLRFLCYHHIGDTYNRQQALRHLCSLQDVSTHTLSNNLTLAGVCYETSGFKDAAFHCYDKALQCDKRICPSAEKRKSRLLNI